MKAQTEKHARACCGGADASHSRKHGIAMLTTGVPENNVHQSADKREKDLDLNFCYSDACRDCPDMT